jgi:hypothetical protein
VGFITSLVLKAGAARTDHSKTVKVLLVRPERNRQMNRHPLLKPLLVRDLLVRDLSPWPPTLVRIRIRRLIRTVSRPVVLLAALETGRRAPLAGVLDA